MEGANISQGLSDKLTPLEIKNKEFKRTLCGYSPQEVVQFLDSVAKLWERIQKRENALVSKIEALSGDIQEWKKKELEFTTLRDAAQTEAEMIRVEAVAEVKKMLLSAREKANQVRMTTEHWLERVIMEVEAIEKERQNLQVNLKENLDQHYQLILTSTPVPLGSQLAELLKETKI